ncbi:MAG: isoleucine--tRNA ligase [Bacteroidales bacterium]|nr:isoleucine--tRNA ligase [Bacteroidales bacterium]
MDRKFKEYKNFDLSQINKEILKKWEENKTFEKSLTTREGNPAFKFNEGPPSANGLPGIHHVLSRTIKDIVCRYKTLKGFYVKRKAGWDTHGLPVELSVEEFLGISKEDIGEKISIEEFNQSCRKEVMKYTDTWEELTRIMGYWINMDHPYVTYDNKYIETLWYLLKELYKKGLLYKDYTIQPYSPAAGTGLSTHELNQPGCYRDVKDTTCVAQFEVIRNEISEFLFKDTDTKVYFLAWTTTPWTLPSNTALAVGEEIKYVKVKTFNPYSSQPVTLILAKDLFNIYFPEKNEDLKLEDYKSGDKDIPYSIIAEYRGKEFKNIKYHQLIDWVKPMKQAFKVVCGDFVTTDEGTGIVHIAPTFGADDYRMAKENDLPPLIVLDKSDQSSPLVDRKGRFFRIEKMADDFVKNYVNTDTYRDFSGRYVKNEYDENLSENDPTVDIDIVVFLKKENKAFKIEKQVHNYPHCWRTDKPVLYYPLNSWFIKTTANKDKLIKLNRAINWKPDATGTGRFGKWLENLQDWNLSRSRFWGTPLPIWVTENRDEIKCIGSVAELKQEIEKAVKTGFMDKNPLADFDEKDISEKNYNKFDLHKPFVDYIILVSSKGEKMFREPDLIDVWFDSGAMPYAQYHYPFENKDNLNEYFPADFIAEGVDQTRGWFFTLHAIACMLFDSVSFKNIISNGLVLDKNGNKMSKRLGNAIDPFDTIEKYGSDPLRWYMITNAQPWDNLKFDLDGVEEVKRKFFGTLYNTYSFFALYANIDNFKFEEQEIPVNARPEIDQWIISLLNSLVKEVGERYEDYDLTRAGRLIQDFVIENLSNWYVRLNRKRYWGGEKNQDKLSAYQTLYTCLETVAILASPIAPFYMDKIFCDLNAVTHKYNIDSVHIIDFPKYIEKYIDKDLEERMRIAQDVSSMVLGLRRKVNLKVRQPLAKIMVPIIDKGFVKKFEAVKELILSEVNVKEVEYISDTYGIIRKTIKPDFKKLGPKYGKLMKQITSKLAGMDQDEIVKFEIEGKFEFIIEDRNVVLSLEDVSIITNDIPGWLVANEGKLTVALDINVTKELKDEGIAREFINRIQNLRKESGFNVTDKINIQIKKNDFINSAIEKHSDYISAQTLANSITLVDEMEHSDAKTVEIDDEIETFILIDKLN